MVDYRARVEAEYELIERTLSVLPKKPLSQLSKLELGGISVLLSNFYNGTESILKQLFKKLEIQLPEGPSWHQHLLSKAVDENIISAELADRIKEYLSFRHVVAHGYTINLRPERLQELVDNVFDIFERFKDEINKCI